MFKSRVLKISWLKKDSELFVKSEKFIIDSEVVGFDPKTKKYYGEDFGFCRKWTAIGGKCYCYVDDFITHVGEYQYNGRLKDNLEFKPVDDSNKTK